MKNKLISRNTVRKFQEGGLYDLDMDSILRVNRQPSQTLDTIPIQRVDTLRQDTIPVQTTDTIRQDNTKNYRYHNIYLVLNDLKKYRERTVTRKPTELLNSNEKPIVSRYELDLSRIPIANAYLKPKLFPFFSKLFSNTWNALKEVSTKGNSTYYSGGGSGGGIRGNNNELSVTTEQTQSVPVLNILVSTEAPSMEEIMKKEILAYMKNNPIQGLTNASDVDKLSSEQIENVYRLILQIYMNLGTTPIEYETPKQEERKEENKETATSLTPYNRADIRSLIRSKGQNPYSDYSAKQRKSLRKYLNNEDNLQYENWMAPFVVYNKKGGRLISNNVITRFKNKKSK